MTSVQRKLAAIVAADVVGYSRLMGKNEEETIAQLRAHRGEVFEPKLNKYRGRIANTAGDSFLIEFASAVDALRYSVEVQAEIAQRNELIPEVNRLEFRFGINLGDVVANGDDLLGDGVNVAARIEALANPGEICISRSVRDQVRDRIEFGLEDLGEVEVKNITRPIRVFRVLGEGAQSANAGGFPSVNSNRVRIGAAAAVVVAMITGGWAIYQQINPVPSTDTATTLLSEPSVAVLPFQNLSGEKSESYFATGITEDIATDLSKVEGLSVASNSAARRLSASETDLSAFASRLGVGHLLEGSVRRANDRIRITAKLIEAKSGNQLWAERFDRDSADIFAIQDEIANQVVVQLSKIFRKKNLKTKSRSYIPDLRAYDYYIKGRSQRIPPTPANLKAAFESFNKAIEIDPQFAGGYAGASLATILAASDSTVTPGSAKAGLKKALELAEKSVELDPDFGPGWGSLAEVYLRTRQYEKNLDAIQKAIHSAPNDSLMLANYGRYLSYVGRADEGIEKVKQAMRMSPDSLPLLYFLGANLRVAGQYDEAIKSLVEHRKRLGGRILPAPTVQLIASYAEAGQLNRAREEAAKLMKAVPDFTLTKAAKIHQYQDREDQRKFNDALVSAGIPK